MREAEKAAKHEDANVLAFSPERELTIKGMWGTCRSGKYKVAQKGSGSELNQYITKLRVFLLVVALPSTGSPLNSLFYIDIYKHVQYIPNSFECAAARE